MSKHTPGPWVIVERNIESDGSVSPRSITGGLMDYDVCQLEPRSVADALINDPNWKKFATSEMAMANANLIAAAPDLLQALERAENMLRYIIPADGPLAEIRAAIAKATGVTT